MATTSAIVSAKKVAAKPQFSVGSTPNNLNNAGSATNATTYGIKTHYGDIYNNDIMNSFVGGYDNINSMYNVGFKQGQGAPSITEDEDTPEPSPPLATTGVDGREANFTQPGIHEGDVYNGKITRSAVGGRRNKTTIRNQWRSE